jgi:hypothetical protein
VKGHDSEIFKLFVEAGYSYTQESCNNMYIQTKVIEECDCFSTIIMSPNSTVKACSSIEDHACYLNTLASLINSDFKTKTQNLCTVVPL